MYSSFSVRWAQCGSHLHQSVSEIRPGPAEQPDRKDGALPQVAISVRQ